MYCTNPAFGCQILINFLSCLVWELGTDVAKFLDPYIIVIVLMLGGTHDASVFLNDIL